MSLVHEIDSYLTKRGYVIGRMVAEHVSASPVVASRVGVEFNKPFASWRDGLFTLTFLSGGLKFSYRLSLATQKYTVTARSSV